MRKVLLVGAGMALLVGGTAFAQTPGPQGGPPGQQSGPGFQGGPPGSQGGPNGGPGGFEGHGPGGPPFMMGHRGGPMRMFMHMMQEASQAARFHLRRGDAELDIKCAANEPMMACVTAANALLDSVGRNQQQRMQ